MVVKSCNMSILLRTTTELQKGCSTMSTREVQILKLIASEFTINEIADALFISPLTVITHRRNMMLKCKVKNMAGLVRVGFERGILNI